MSVREPDILSLTACCLCLFSSFFLSPVPVAMATQATGNSSAVATSKVEGVLDEIQISGNTLKARGWAGADDSANPVTGIHLLLDGVEIYKGGFEKQERPDVARAKGRPDWLESGWLIEAPLIHLPPDGPRKISAAALLKNGERFDLRVPEGLVPVVSSTPPTSQELLGHLDEVVLEGDRLKVRGWAASPDPSQKIQAILLKSGNEILYRGKFESEERPDVATALSKPELLRSGWVVRLDWSGKPAPSSITPQFEMETGEIIPLPVPVGVPSPASVAPSATQSNPILTRIAWLAAVLLAGLAGWMAYQKFQQPGTPPSPAPGETAPFQRPDTKSFGFNLTCLLFFAFAVFLKAPHQFANPQFWAEDGVVFFQEAQEKGFHSLFVPYAGYCHLIPRLVAYTATFFPIVVSPTIYLYSSYLILLGIAWSYLQLPNTNHARLFLLVSMILVPIQGEVFLNLTNLQWIIAPFILVVFFSNSPDSATSRFLISTGLFFVCLTGPFSIFFAPFIAATFLIKKITIYRIVNFGILGACSLVQGLLLMKSERLDKSLPSLDFFNSIVFNNFLGSILLGRYLAPILPVMCYAAGGLFLAWILICIIQLRKKDVLVASCLFILAFTLLFLGLQAANNNPGISPFTIGQRYFYIPSILLIWLSGLLISRVHKLRVIGIAWLVLIGFSAISSYSSAPLLDYRWSELIKDPRRSEIIPINPPNWKISIPHNEK